ncbi:MAG: hypothetical protein B1H08_03520 [Candidatus Omnitrophica bacterium 4484_171]|nr:MAG: hypothetical protein B1H08_03520 [Candidatus Omnitrophica bacterium 4484_171]
MRIKRTQTMLEYSVMTAVIAASLVLMSVYLKRGYSGRIKTQSDSLGVLYDAENISSTSTYSIDSHTVTDTYVDNITIDGESYLGLVSTENVDENVTQTANQTITK